MHWVTRIRYCCVTQHAMCGYETVHVGKPKKNQIRIDTVEQRNTVTKLKELISYQSKLNAKLSVA